MATDVESDGGGGGGGSGDAGVGGGGCGCGCAAASVLPLLVELCSLCTLSMLHVHEYGEMEHQDKDEFDAVMINLRGEEPS